MVTIDLTNPSNSNIDYKVNQFPDGQQSLELTGSKIGHSPRYTIAGNSVMIKSRIGTFRDIELISCAVSAVRNLVPNKEIELYVPYIMGARSDRMFGEGGVNYMKQVIAPVINSFGFTRVHIMDAHSDVTEAVINNYQPIQLYDKFIEKALTHPDCGGSLHGIALISPDAGAYKKVFGIAKKHGIGNVTVASKVRDIKTGQIVKTELPPIDFDGVNSIVIIDDICDGGRTFIELVKAIREQTASITRYIPIVLIVTHGIFSAGFRQLMTSFDTIFTTNSYRDWPVDMEQLNVTDVFTFVAIS